MVQCTAKSKRTGQRCKGQAVTGKSVCYFHGGKSLSGPASGTWKTGKYSKDIPARLIERYQEALNDAELLSVAEEVAVVEARERELLAGIDRGESGRLWLALRQEHQALMTAQASKDAKAMAASLSLIGTIISQGAAEAQRWAELLSVMDHKRVLAESERRRLLEAEHVITERQALALGAALVAQVKQAIEEHVEDERLRGVIIDAARERFAALAGVNHGGPTGAVAGR